ncbi:hypothetical protein [Asticcacaulis sp.]|uniref:hypothetical protein n=1 Tax=Asticcacaulis sp. TaxID=1872648 RepID=UPI0026264B0C|nr:hypothetical protein [Asticcacaulis sp.]
MRKALNILAWVFAIFMSMSALGGFISGDFLLGTVVLLIGLMALPPLWQALEKQSIKTPVWVRWIAGFALFIAFAVFNGSPISRNTTKDAKAVATANTDKAAMPLSSRPTKEQKTKQAQAFMQDVIAAASPCDKLSLEVARATEAMDMVEIYRTSRNAERVCSEARSEFNSIQLPSYLTSEGRKNVREGLTQMSNAYDQRAYGYSKLKQAADGDLRPSVVTDAQEAMEGVQGQVISAIATLYMALGADGADPEKIMESAT